MKERLVLCLGNEVLSDDGFGFAVARQLLETPEDLNADVQCAALAGLALLDLINERRAVLVVDAIVTGSVLPGTITEFPADTLAPTWNLIGSHQINLPTAIELGRLMGMTMPEQIDVIAVEAGDVHTLHEGLTSPVAHAVDKVVARTRQWAAQPFAAAKPISKSAAAVHP